MISRTDADWAELASAYGQALGDGITLRRALAERDAELRDARAQIAALSDQLYKPPDGEEGAGP